jgi:Ran GTPase-activating protein (RanGAP) involved in mRNA processing and transport
MSKYASDTITVVNVNELADTIRLKSKNGEPSGIFYSFKNFTKEAFLLLLILLGTPDLVIDSITLYHVAICGKVLDSAWANKIAKALRRNKHVKTVDLGYNKIGDFGAQIFAKTFNHRFNPTITNLSLLGNYITIKGISALTKVLETNKGLKTLDLSHNNFGVKGLEYLAGMLMVNKTITSLDAFDSTLKYDKDYIYVYNLLNYFLKTNQKIENRNLPLKQNVITLLCAEQMAALTPYLWADILSLLETIRADKATIDMES